MILVFFFVQIVAVGLTLRNVPRIVVCIVDMKETLSQVVITAFEQVTDTDERVLVINWVRRGRCVQRVWDVVSSVVVSLKASVLSMLRHLVTGITVERLVESVIAMT